jgi:hypothetical protein
VTLTLDRPALAGGVTLLVYSASPAVASVPPSAFVPAGSSTATFDVHGEAVGGPVTISAELPGGADGSAAVRVHPRVLSVTGAGEVFVGAGGSFTVTMESAPTAPMTVTLFANAALSVPATVTVSAASAPFTATGLALGAGTITAGAGSSSAGFATRVTGVFLSEILYDPIGSDTTGEWIELYNAGSVPVSLVGLRIRRYTTAWANVRSLTGTLDAGGCLLLNGPFTNALGNDTSGGGDGVALEVISDGTLVDDVIYGASNSHLVPDENGSTTGPPDIGPVPAEGQTLERTSVGIAGPWQIQPTPTPGSCAAIL